MGRSGCQLPNPPLRPGEQGTGDFQNDKSGIGGYAERNIRFGVREHAMGAITNGIALHESGLIPYCATCGTPLTSKLAPLRLPAWNP